MNKGVKKKPQNTSALNSKLIRRQIKKKFWLFLMPTFLAFCIGFVWPFIFGIYLSFFKFLTIREILTLDFSKISAHFVGFENYVRAFSDVSFRRAFFYTSAFTVVSVLVINILAFFLAYLLTQNGIKGKNIFRTVFFMPNLIGGIVLGYIWKLIFDGILIRYNTYLTSNATYGFWGLVILLAWQQIGYMMIIYISGFQSVSDDIIEAASIDGANRWQTLFKIIIPNMMASITICTFLSLTNSFKLYDQNLSLTGGLPIVTNGGVQTKLTEMLALNISSSFASQGAYARGTAQAKAVLFFIMVAIISLIQLRATRSKEVQK